MLSLFQGCAWPGASESRPPALDCRLTRTMRQNNLDISWLKTLVLMAWRFLGSPQVPHLILVCNK